MQVNFVLDTIGGEESTMENTIIYDPAISSVGDNSGQNFATRKPMENSRNFRKFANIKRYHENEKFTRLKPGVLSSDLREALGISLNEIPLHVYRMRSIGYPPGWLMRAKVDRLPSFNAETTLTNFESVVYDERAFIKYPGFNVYDGNLRDEYREFRCPRIQENCLLENFSKTLLENPSAKIDHVDLMVENEDLDVLMEERQRILSEINALESTLAQNSPSRPGVLKGPLSSSQNNQEIGAVESVDVKTDSRWNVDDGDNEFAVGLRADHEESSSNCSSSNVVSSGSSADTSKTGADCEVVTLEKKAVETEESAVELEIEEGTTIPINLSKLVEGDDEDDSIVKFEPSALLTAHQKVPDLEAFSHGIQPYQPFENLPNSQGAYNRVRETLLKVKADPSFFTKPLTDQAETPPTKPPLLETPSSPTRSNGCSFAPTESRSRFSSSPWHHPQHRLSRRERGYFSYPIHGRRHVVDPYWTGDRWAPQNGYDYFQNAPPVNGIGRASYGGPCDVRHCHRNYRYRSEDQSAYRQYTNSSHSRCHGNVPRHRDYRY